MIAEVQKMVKEYREAEQKHLGYSRLKDTDVLRALVFILRMAYGRTSADGRSRGPLSIFCLHSFRTNHQAVSAPEEVGSRIITP